MVLLKKPCGKFIKDFQKIVNQFQYFYMNVLEKIKKDLGKWTLRPMSFDARL